MKARCLSLVANCFAAVARLVSLSRSVAMLVCSSYQNKALSCIGQSQLKKVFEKDAAVAGFIWMFPACAALIPVFEGLFQVKLNGINKLAVGSFYHHLV